MKKWNVSFVGREVGAIGITYWHSVTVEAETKEAALLKVYDTHEHISQSMFTEVGGPTWKYGGGEWIEVRRG